MLYSPHYPCLRIASANSSQGILQRHNYDNFCIASRVSSNTWCFRKNCGDAKHSTVFSSSLHRHLDPSNSLLLLMVPVPAFKNPFIYLCVCLWMFKGIADDEMHICSHCTTLTLTTVLVSSAFDMPATKSFCSYCVFEIDMRVWYPDCLADEKVSLDVGKLIQQSRMGKKLTQKDLATVRALWKL